jgi:transcriptional regulator with XRE-family HTH domain
MSLIQKRIDERHISQADLARRLSVSRQTVSAWVTRARTPRARTLKRLAEELNISVAKLIADFCD